MQYLNRSSTTKRL